jgi:hypothetical protein
MHSHVYGLAEPVAVIFATHWPWPQSNSFQELSACSCWHGSLDIWQFTPENPELHVHLYWFEEVELKFSSHWP